MYKLLYTVYTIVANVYDTPFLMCASRQHQWRQRAEDRAPGLTRLLSRAGFTNKGCAAAKPKG
jgi:hypothetical protein